MSWWGKILGGAFGFVLGGPLGALIGAALGHNFDRGLAGIGSEAGDEGVELRERSQAAFFTATFSVMGHLAKADGRVTPEEIQMAEAVMDELHLAPQLRETARRLFGEGKRADFDLDGVLDQLRRECRRSRNLMRMFLEVQLQAALADGVVSAGERAILEHACERLGIPRIELDRLEAFIGASRQYRSAAGGARGPARMPLEDAYALLEVPPDASDAEIKRAYRRMMSRHHPDKLVAKGLPEEMMRAATEKTQQIKAAYERVKEARGD